LALIERAAHFIPYVENRVKKTDTLRGRTLVNLFFENSTRTQASFEVAGKRLGADVVNMSVRASSVVKGETLIDTAATLNAMAPDLLVVRHPSSGAAHLLARKVGCSVINAGDGMHEHPTQALLDALTITHAVGPIEGLVIAICGDVAHSRVARSNIRLLTMLGATVRIVAPPTLLPTGVERWGAEVFTDMKRGLPGADVVMMLRIQLERMQGGFTPSQREFFWFYGLDPDKLALTGKKTFVMHPGPMNRGVEIDSVVADDPRVSLIERQVRMGVALRMAVLEALAAKEGA
jgi:aspartate carbamoyltransferase catalytic subunit